MTDISLSEISSTLREISINENKKTQSEESATSENKLKDDDLTAFADM